MRTGNGTGHEIPAAGQPDRLFRAWHVRRAPAGDHRDRSLGVPHPGLTRGSPRADGSRQAGGGCLPDAGAAHGRDHRPGSLRAGGAQPSPPPPPPPPPPGPELPPPPPLSSPPPGASAWVVAVGTPVAQDTTMATS